MNSPESLKHTKWECKYHIIWIPKYRKKGLYKELRQYLGSMLKDLASQKEWRGVAIFTKAFMGISAQRIRIDCVSKANHNLIRLLDKPGVNISKYVFGGIAKWGVLEDVSFS